MSCLMPRFWGQVLPFAWRGTRCECQDDVFATPYRRILFRVCVFAPRMLRAPIDDLLQIAKPLEPDERPGFAVVLDGGVSWPPFGRERGWFYCVPAVILQHPVTSRQTEPA